MAPNSHADCASRRAVIPAGSVPPHSERTRVSADVPDRPMPNTNRTTGRPSVPVSRGRSRAPPRARRGLRRIMRSSKRSGQVGRYRRYICSARVPRVGRTATHRRMDLRCASRQCGTLLMEVRLDDAQNRSPSATQASHDSRRAGRGGAS